MFDTLRALLRPASPARTDVAPDLAIAALLVDAARADGVYAPAEKAEIDALLRSLLDIPMAEASALRLRAEAAHADAADIVRFTRVIKAALDEEARRDLMQALWSVVLADGQRDAHEDALMRHLAPLIALHDHDSAAARRRALAERGT